MKNNFDKVLTTKKIKKVYHYKNFTTKHWFFYPLMIVCWWYDKFTDKIQERRKWNEKRTIRILNYAFPKGAFISKKNQTITRYITTWQFKWYLITRAIDGNYCRKFNDKITDYLINNYEIKGYTKTIENDEDEPYEYTIIFKKN